MFGENFRPAAGRLSNIARDRRTSVSEMWTSLLCNIDTDAAASVAGLEEGYFSKHRYFFDELCIVARFLQTQAAYVMGERHGGPTNYEEEEHAC